MSSRGTPLSEKHTTNMNRVLVYIEQGVHDRAKIAKELGITKRQVRYAIWNLVAKGLIEAHKHHFKNGHGRGDTIYRIKGKHVEQKSPLAGVSFIFNFVQMSGTASEDAS